MNKLAIELLIKYLLPSFTWPIAVALKLYKHTLTETYLQWQFTIGLKCNATSHLQTVTKALQFYHPENNGNSQLQAWSSVELPHITEEQAFYFQLRGASYHEGGERQKWIQGCSLSWSNTCHLKNKVIHKCIWWLTRRKWTPHRERVNIV